MFVHSPRASVLQVLLRLCTQRAAVEELARKDDLNLLFSAVSSVCPPHNNIWRKTSSDVLLTISRHSLSQPVISYLHNKGCMAMCIENMQRGAGTDIAPLEIVEMFVTIFCFLKDSSTVSQTLLDDFRTCQGYIFLSEFLLKLEQVSVPATHVMPSINQKSYKQTPIRTQILSLARLSVTSSYWWPV